MKTTMKKIVSILLFFVTVMSISSVTAFATETKFNRYEQIRYLNDEERYDFIWKSFTYGQSNELAECEKNDDLLTLSIAREELKNFVSQLGDKYNEIDYQVTDASADFSRYLHNKYGNIVPYSEEVVQYLKSHTNANLQWSFDNDKKEYSVSDNPSWGCYVALTGKYMQYSDDNVSDILFWAYDEATNKYICKNENGKVVNSVTKYHLKNETSSSETASTSSNSSTNSSQTSSMTDNKPDTASYSATTGSPKMESALTASGDDTPTTTESVGPDTQEVVFADDSSNPSTTQIILIVIGVLIIAGIIVIIIMLNKKKKEE